MSDAPSPKEQQLRSWTSVAPGWKKHDERLLRASEPCTRRLLELVRLEPGTRVLDIASGTGEPAIPAALKVGPSGQVLGTDFVEPMLAFAREKAVRAGVKNVEFRCIDGETLDVPPGSFDAVTIRWGIMFMPDAASCLEQAHRALKPGGRIAVACWAAPEKNPWASIPMGIVMRHAQAPKPPPGSPGLFAYADPARLTGVLAGAGFIDVSHEAVDLPMIDVDSAEEYWTYISELAGPIATLFAKLTPEQQEVAGREIAAEVTRVSPGGRVVLGGTTWVAAGSAASAPA
jgi:SAM-dependent methyltransferase